MNQPQPGSATDPFWYKDAIIYQLHVKSFFDSANDGIGDFPGLTQKLDYIQGLGVTALWLLPFYPSPLRDDGYDIAHYEGVHPAYGTLRDFRTFLKAAHQRGLQVITELVVNHTSDQHAWFQAARRAPAGSSKRNFYVWSDTKRRYEGARIIFTDSETSNWTWDEAARAYYWHRFFHHQPDLNFDNPRVRHAVIKVMRFWFDLGVDGMRLDAVPYLIEREGTNCENLPETHGVLREIRRLVDAHYLNRMLLAEANQWPADVRPYFGDGDECHMAFNFPLMPRIFMALRQEDRHPITNILNQTPSIPEGCQWAIFLRNHDELTLEMVTDEERDYMYQQYAADPQMRLNMGIRRRLAPLMENSRRRIELLNSLLLSLPGTPVLYYGDELGMGDNIYLGDRNGVRTPMQWTGDRNAGFSRADPAKLYAPLIMDPVYGYQAVNVEAQERSPFSLLNWMKRMLALRKQHRTFSRGALDILYPQNRKVLAYVRSYEGEVILALANLSRHPQPAELDLRSFAGLTPVEMLGRTEFPRISDAPYFVTLGPYGFYWFLLERTPASVTARVAQPIEEPVDLVPLVLAGGAWDTLLDGNVRTVLERDALVPFLRRQRWFAGKGRSVRAARFKDWTIVRRQVEPTFLMTVQVEYTDGATEEYFLPLALVAEPAASALAESAGVATSLSRIAGARKGLIVDATVVDEFCRSLLEAVTGRAAFALRQSVMRGFVAAGFTAAAAGEPPSLTVRRGSAEQSNTSIIYSDRLILKLFRRLERGPNPELEIGRFLTERAGFARVPRTTGWFQREEPGDKVTALALLQTFVPSQANGWDHAIEELKRYYERAEAYISTSPPPELAAGDPLAVIDPPLPTAILDLVGGYRESAATLGRRTAELHLALAQPSDDPAFAPELLSPEDLDRLRQQMTDHGLEALRLLEANLDRLPAEAAARARVVLEDREPLTSTIHALVTSQVSGGKIRVHGDYHLGQVLWSESDFIILDFEGEPARSLAERRTKQSPLKDVAGMLRSFSYAAYAALLAHTMDRPDLVDRLEPWAECWQTVTSAAFLRAYLATVGPASFVSLDRNSLRMLLRAFMLDKAFYELAYEINSRPEWVRIPLWGMTQLLRIGSG